MRTSRVTTLHLVGAAALLAACGGGDSTGPSNNTPPTAAFTLSCSDLDCTFTDGSSDADGSVTKWAWNFGDQTTATTQSPNHSFAAAGTYTVGLTVTDNGGATNSTTRDVTVTAPTQSGLSASFTVACASLDCTITNTTTGVGASTTWSWTFGDGQTSSAQNPPPVHYDVTSPTNFAITLVVVSDGQTSQATQVIRVAPPATLSCNGAACTLLIEQNSTVLVTLKSSSCQVHGNLFRITAPIVDTLFTDGCYAPVDPAPGSSFPLDNNGSSVFNAGTQLDADVSSGVIGAQNPQLRVTGTFADGWTLAFDDGFVGPNEPDFNDLIIFIKATPTP